MLALALSVLAALPVTSTASASPGGTITLAPRQTLDFLTLATEVLGQPTAQLNAELTALFDQHTDLTLSPVSDPQALEKIRSCAGRLACIARAIPRGTAATHSGFLLLFSVRNVSQGGVRILSELLDARRLATVPDGADPQEDESSVLNRSELLASTPGALQQKLKDLLATSLRPQLDDTNHWDPFAQVEIAAPTAISISLDDHQQTVAGPGPIVLNTTPGPHKLRIKGADVHEFELQIEPKRRETTLLAPEFPSEAEYQRRQSNHEIVFWTGVGVTALGAASLVVAVAANPHPNYLYVHAAEMTVTPQSRFWALGADPAHGAVLPAPLGYSLALAGLLMLAVDQLYPGRTVWLPALLGVLAGGTAYSISYALNPKTP